MESPEFHGQTDDGGFVCLVVQDFLPQPVSVLCQPRDSTDVVHLDRLGEIDKALAQMQRVLDLDPDKTGAMGTTAKACAKMLGIESDFESDVIDSAISEAIRGGNVLVFASGGMSDLVSRRVEEYSRKSGNTIRWERLI